MDDPIDVTPTAREAVEQPSAVDPLDPMWRLAEAMREGGGDPMALNARNPVLGGARIRFWMPSRAAAAACVAIADEQHWRHMVMNHYDHPSMTEVNGVQVVIDLPLPG